MSDRTNDLCKHFGGMRPPTCAVGVNVREITGGPDLGWLIRIPCRTTVEMRGGKPVPRATCPQFELPTDEEHAAEEAKWEAIVLESERRMKLGQELFRRIRRENKGRSNSGSDPCPACEGGTLYWRIAGYNGHIHARCTTDGCISFME